MLESPEIDGRASNACNVQRFRNGVLGSPGRDVTGDVPASIDDISSPRKELRLRISVFRRNWSTTGSLTSDNLYRLPVAQSSRRSSCHPCRTLTLLWPDAGAVVGSSKLRALSVMMASMSRVEAIRIGRWETRVGRSAIGSAARRRCRGPDHVTRRCTHRYSTASRLGGTADVVERTRLSEVRAEPMPKRPGPSWRSRPEDLRGLSTPPPDSVRIASGLPWHPMEGYPLT